MTYTEFVALLSTAGYKVAAPTEQNVALPCYTVEPVGMVMLGNNPVVMESCEVVARTTLGEGDLGNWSEVSEMLYSALRTFMGTPVGFDEEIEIDSNVNTNPATITGTIRAVFPGQTICGDVP